MEVLFNLSPEKPKNMTVNICILWISIDLFDNTHNTIQKRPTHDLSRRFLWELKSVILVQKLRISRGCRKF